MEPLIYLILGILTGTVTGLIPGLHVNTVLAFATSTGLDPTSIITYVVALSITHSMLDHIPAVLLGIPDADSALSILPGHKLTLKGKATHAIKLTIIGGLITTIIAILLSPILLYLMRDKQTITTLIPYGLIAATALLVMNEKNKLLTILVIVLASTLGILTWGAHFDFNELLPTLTGLFGISTLITSLQNEPIIPLQKNSVLEIDNKSLLKNGTIAAISGSIVGLLPAIGSAQSAFIATNAMNKPKEEDYLTILGGINTANAFYTFLALFYLHATRSGATAYIQQYLPQITFTQVLTMMSTGITAVGISTIIGLLFSHKIVTILTKINYKLLTRSLLVLITLGVTLITGLSGLLLMLTGTAIGLTTIYSNVRRISLMSFLSTPTVLFYLGLL